MSDTGQSKGLRIAFGLVIILILYNIGSGLIVKKLGIPGIFEIEFDKPVAQLPAKPKTQTETGTPSQTPSQSQPQTHTGAQQQQTTWQFVQPPSLPSSACPQVPGMFWMAYPNTWYGPFYGYFLAWDRAGGFYVWDPYLGQIPYPDPFVQVQRNAWLRLPNSPFNICVDGSTGNVFGQYNPY
jgi:hypothetical protein